MDTLLTVLAYIGIAGLFGTAVWLVYAATQVIEGVNEPGLYRKLKEQRKQDKQ